MPSTPTLELCSPGTARPVGRRDRGCSATRPRPRTGTDSSAAKPESQSTRPRHSRSSATRGKPPSTAPTSPSASGSVAGSRGSDRDHAWLLCGCSQEISSATSRVGGHLGVLRLCRSERFRARLGRARQYFYISQNSGPRERHYRRSASRRRCRPWSAKIRRGLRLAVGWCGHGWCSSRSTPMPQ